MTFALILAGCSVPPQVEDLADYKTIEIVDRIRCEAKDAIQSETFSLLENQPSPENLELTSYLKSLGTDWQTKKIRNHLITDKQKQFYLRYIESSLVLDFTFDLSESNKNSTEIDVLKAISKGTVGLNFIASDEHKRGNRQQFLISETFGHLLDDRQVCFPPKYDLARRSENFGISQPIAPITGRINIFGIIHTFIQINREGILEKKKDDAAPTLADTLMFTTTYIGSINPTIAISPIGRTFDFKLASLTGQATRSDINQVVIGLSLKPKIELAPRTERPVGTAGLLVRGAGADAFARRRIQPSEQRAIEAVSQQKIDTFYDRFNVLR